MYIEASSPRKREDNAKLYSPPLAFPGHMCLEFYYHMSGEAIGSLKVTINEKVVFSRSGGREDKWYKASINVSAIVGLHRVINVIFFISLNLTEPRSSTMGKRCPLKVVIEEVKKTLGIFDHIFFYFALETKHISNLTLVMNFLFFYLSVKKKTK